MKLLFSDLDDTLLNSDKTISNENLEAVKAMTEAGHGFVLCTGRPLFSALVLARQYGFLGDNYYIASFNGGLIVETKNMTELFHEGLSLDTVRILFDEARKWGLYAQTYSDSHVLVEEDSDYIKWYSDRIRMPYKVVDCVTDYLNEDPLKCIVAHPSDHDRLVQFKNEVGATLKSCTENIFSNPVLLEFGSIKASKGIAVKELAKILKVPMENTYAAGDEENDIAMIVAAHTGIAVKNAVPSVLEIADVITENDNNHNAIKEIIEKYILQ